MYDEQRVRELRDLPIEVTDKGFGGPLHCKTTTASALADTRPHVGDGWLSSPRALLRESALRHNIATMARYCSDHGVALYPHAKTTMAPQIVAAQLASGAGGITVATVAQARVFRRFGVGRIMIANQVVDEAAIAWLGRELSEGGDLSLTCYVDSHDGVDVLTSQLSRYGGGRPLPVLVELGHANGRTGARTRADALQIAAAVARSSRLALVGIAGYEGSIVAETVEATVRATRVFCEDLRQLAVDLTAAGLVEPVPIVTAGGSAFFDVVVATLAGTADWSLVLRSGCYVTHDQGLYRSVSPFERSAGSGQLRAALRVWAPVLSRPEPGVAVLGAGRRDLSADAGLPVVIGARSKAGAIDVGAAFSQRIFDQHVVVAVPDDCGLSPGDEVALGISHPCTTFDKWRWLPVVDDHDRIVDVVRTFF